jgi:hypothetical protein
MIIEFSVEGVFSSFLHDRLKQRIENIRKLIVFTSKCFFVNKITAKTIPFNHECFNFSRELFLSRFCQSRETDESCPVTVKADYLLVPVVTTKFACHGAFYKREQKPLELSTREVFYSLTLYLGALVKAETLSYIVDA